MSDILRPTDPRRLFPSASLRCRRASPPRAGLQLARCSRRFRLPVSRNAFQLSGGYGPLRSGHAREAHLCFIYRYASERRIRLAHHSIPPVQPAARQTQQIVDRAAKQDQDTEILTSVESFFSTIYRSQLWGKDSADFSNACQFFRKTTDKLFAGISTTLCRRSPLSCAKGAMSCSRSRMPQRASRAFRLSSKASFEGAVWTPFLENGP